MIHSMSLFDSEFELSPLRSDIVSSASKDGNEHSKKTISDSPTSLDMSEGYWHEYSIVDFIDSG